MVEEGFGVRTFRRERLEVDPHLVRMVEELGWDVESEGKEVVLRT